MSGEMLIYDPCIEVRPCESYSSLPREQASLLILRMSHVGGCGSPMATGRPEIRSGVAKLLHMVAELHGSCRHKVSYSIALSRNEA